MNYRRIWEKSNGKIPIDQYGHKFEIHHVDGDRSNNQLSNLICISILDHFKLHLEKGEYAAAFRISQRMDIDTKLKSKLASLSNKKRIKEGTHPFNDPEIRKKAFDKISKRIEEGIQGLQNPEISFKAVEAKKNKYSKEDLSSFAKKGWEKWKQEGNDSKQRTKKGSTAGAEKIRNTNWYYNQKGEHLRTTEDDPTIKEGWIKGRFNGKELSRKANLSKLKNKQ